MTVITCEQLPELFAAVGGLFTEKRDELCEMDAQMGDGDLGLTMSKGYGALPQLLRDNMEPGDIGKTLMKGGMKMSSVVPSTMGTLMSSGIMAGGIMAMIMCFNSFVMQYYLIPIGTQTLPTLVFTRIRSGYQADLNALSAIIVLIAVGIVILLVKLGFSAGSLFGTVSGSSSKKGE